MVVVGQQTPSVDQTDKTWEGGVIHIIPAFAASSRQNAVILVTYCYRNEFKI